MNLLRPFYFLAITVAIVSSVATQANAQDPASILACEQFNAAVAEIEGAFVVSGLQTEETNLIQIEDFEAPRPNSTTRLQFINADAPQLTLPMGIITRTRFVTNNPPSGDFLERHNITFLVLGSDGEAAEAFFFYNDTYSLRPDPSLGTACGFCLTSDSGFFNESPIEDGVVSFYDGDTLIGQTSGPDFSFFAKPEETITRIDFAGLGFAFDFQVAFCPDTPMDTEVTPQQQALSFEDPSVFETVFGQGSFSGEDSVVSQGNGSLNIAPGYSNVQTPKLSTSEFPPSTTGFSVDLFVGSQQPNPFYIGSLQTYVHAPSANIYNQYVGQVQLTNVTQDEFITHNFVFSPFVAGLLAGDVEDVQFRFVLNVNGNSGPYFLDNIQLSE